MLTTIRPIATAEILDAALDASIKWEGQLGRGKRGKAQKAFEALKAGRLEVGSPQPYTKRLSAQMFREQGLDLPDEIWNAASDAHAVYYLIAFPVMLYPGRGAQYRLLECEVSVGEDTLPSESAIYRIFPESEWKGILSWGAQLNLAVDAQLSWGIELDKSQINMQSFKGDISSKVGNINELQGFIKILPFEYNLGRMEIDSTFTTNRAMWRLNSKQAIHEKGNLWLAALTRCPRSVTRIDVEIAIQAEVSMDWLTAQISHVFERLPEALREMISKERRGPPLQSFKTWQVRLP